MRDNVNKLIFGVLLLFIKLNGITAPVSRATGSTPHSFKKQNEEWDEKFDYTLNRHSAGFNFGRSLTQDGENFSYYFYGLNYELRLYDFLGISLNCKAGEQYLIDNARYEFNERYEPILKGRQYFNAKTQTVSIAPKVYLNIWREAGIYFFGEFGSGMYFLKSTGKTISEEGAEYTSRYNSDPGFYYYVNLGLDVYFTKKVMAWITIGGENIDFKNAYNNLNWAVPWISKSMPDSELLFSIGFKFYW